jgi:hypothetical protein
LEVILSKTLESKGFLTFLAHGKNVQTKAQGGFQPKDFATPNRQ